MSRVLTLCARNVCAGQIEAGDLLVALRSLGFEPRKDEVKKLMSDNDKDNSGKINKPQFLEIFRAKWVSLSLPPTAPIVPTAPSVNYPCSVVHSVVVVRVVLRHVCDAG